MPAPRNRTEAGRTPTAVKLRRRPEDALRPRTTARESGVDLSEDVVRLLDELQRAAAARLRASLLTPAEVSRLAGELGALPSKSGVRVERAFGLLKHLFEMPLMASNAKRHSFDLSETTRDARAAIQNVVPRSTGRWRIWRRRRAD